MLAMTLQKLLKVSLVSIGLSVALGACSRDHIEAENLANEGDQAVKVNVEGAIQKYEQAIQLDPTNHRILWKLAVAYEKKEDWEKMASTLSRAVQVAPDFANYWFKRLSDRYNLPLIPVINSANKGATLVDCVNDENGGTANVVIWLLELGQ
jgi:tetratricopeptide (TPR) repeat protein